MADVKQTFDGDANALLREYEKLSRAVTKLEEDNARLSGKVEQQQDRAVRQQQAQSRAIDRQIEGIGRLAVGYFAADKALQGFLDSQRRQDELAKSSIQSAQTVASAQQALVLNLQESDEETARILKSVQEINRVQRIGGEEAVAAMTTTMSRLVSGTGDPELSRNITSEMAQLFRQDLSQLPVAAGAAGDIASIIGDQSGRQAIGLVLAAQADARADELTKFKQMSRGVAAMVSVDESGDKFQATIESLAFQSALSRSLKDPDLEVTRTAATKLSQQLAELLPAEDIIGPGGEIRREGTGLRTFAERFKRLQEDEELRRVFQFGDPAAGIKPASLEQAAPVIFKALEDQNTQLSREFRANLNSLRPDTELLDRLQRQVAAGTPELELSTRIGAGESRGEELRADDRLRLAGLSIERLREAREIADAEGANIDEWLGNAEIALGRMFRIDPVALRIREMEQLRNQLADPGGFGMFGITPPVSDDRQQQLDKLDEMIQELRDLKKAVEEGNQRPPLQINPQSQVGANAE